MLKQILLATTASLAAFVVEGSAAQAQPAAALAGQVSSMNEGAMEGVIVSARKDGATMTISVVSDNKGHYSFPAAKLEPGHYTLKMRAVGYDLDGAPAADVKQGATATADLKLSPTKNLQLQLTNAELLGSAPGSDQQKKFLLSCNSCHS